MRARPDACRALSFKAVRHALFAAALAASVAPLGADGIAVDGHDRARVVPPSGAAVEAYRNAGYALEPTPDGLVITVDASPLGSREPFALPRVARSDQVGDLARRIAAGAHSRFEAVSRILGWVARTIRYELDRGSPQDPASVLARRSAYCTGLARLTVVLLEALGIPAREVAGYVVESHPESGGPAGYHRWVEVEYPDRGWVFSDPAVSHHYVGANYVRLASERISEPSGSAEGALVERELRLSPVDVFPGAAPGITARRNSALQLAAALLVRAGSEATGLAVLEGEGKRYRRSLLAGETTFVGLEPGHYTLRLLLEGRAPLERPVELLGRIHRTVVLPPSGVASRPVVLRSPHDSPSRVGARLVGAGGANPVFHTAPPRDGR